MLALPAADLAQEPRQTNRLLASEPQRTGIAHERQKNQVISGASTGPKTTVRSGLYIEIAKLAGVTPATRQRRPESLRRHFFLTREEMSLQVLCYHDFTIDFIIKQ